MTTSYLLWGVELIADSYMRTAHYGPLEFQLVLDEKLLGQGKIVNRRVASSPKEGPRFQSGIQKKRSASSERHSHIATTDSHKLVSQNCGLELSKGKGLAGDPTVTEKTRRLRLMKSNIGLLSNPKHLRFR